MKKENILPANVGDLGGRMTRARASILNASNRAVSSRAITQQGQKKILRASSKRAAPDENNTSKSDFSGVQPKRRAVLRDVTNVCCENSYKSCFNASGVQTIKGKQVKKGRPNVSKVAPALPVELPNVPAMSKIKIVQTTLEAEQISQVKSSTTLDRIVSSRFREIGVGDKVVKPCSRILSKPCSRMPSKPISPPKKAEKPCFNVSDVESSDPDFIDIDGEDKDPQLCSLYAVDIYRNLRTAELARRPQSAYMEETQKDITQVMRGILVDWLVEVSEEYKLVPDTLYLTVYLIDCFLSQNYMERHLLQLLGITCMLIASKYEEICAPRVEEFCFITDNTYSRGEVLDMESLVLKHFGFRIFAPTAKSFLRRFLRAAQASYESPSYELEYLADYLAELTLTDYNFLNVLPSVIAASAVFLARWTIDQSTDPWNTTLEHYTYYKASDIKNTVFALRDLQLNTNGCPLNAVRMKYRQEKFKCVASLSSPKLLETLFY